MAMLDRGAVTFVALGLVALAGSSTAAADEVAGFYRGRQIQMVIGHEVGGGYDIYARLVGRHLSRHLPGSPRIVPQNMLGAGSRTAANFLYSVAPRDGSTIGMTAQTTPLDQVLKLEGVAFDAAQFNWIGNPIVDNQVFFAWHALGIRSFEEAGQSTNGLLCGGTNSSSNPSTLPKLINHIVGTRIRLTLGYPSARSILLAMERGEVNCLGSYSWSTAKATVADLMRDNKLNVLVQWGPQKDPEISAYAKRDVPLMPEYGRNDDHHSLIRLISAGMALGRPIYAPPGVPQARVAALRKAFDDVMKDPELLAEAVKIKADIRPMSGAELQSLVGEVVRTPPDVIASMREILK